MNDESIKGQYSIEPFCKRHSRQGFTCDVKALDDYFKTQASQDARRNVAAVFVAVNNVTGNIGGFYTLSMASVSLELIPAELAGKMPRYPSVPSVRLGRLAVNKGEQGKGLGTYMLMDAIHRSLENEIAWSAFIVDAKDEQARKFYLQFGFMSFNDNPRHLFLLRKTIEQAFH